MPNVNIPSGDSESGANKVKVRKSQDTLLNRLLQDTLANEVSEYEPTGLNLYEKDTDAFHTRLRTNMKDRRDESRVGATNIEEGTTGTITDEEIDSIEASTIQRQFLKQTRRLTSLRSRLFYTLKSTYPHVRDQDDWESRLMKEIKLQGTEDMESLIRKIKTKKVAGRFLKGVFGQNLADEILHPEIRNLREIFSDREILDISENEKKDLSRIIENRERFGQTPGSDEVRRILGYYANATIERKKTLLVSLGAVISLSDATEWSLLTERGFERIATRYFGDAYTTLDDIQKKEFRRSLGSRSTTDQIYIDFDEIDGGNIEDIFRDTTKTKQIADGIFAKLADEIPAKNRPEADILKKAAELYPDEEDHQKLFNLYTEYTLKNRETAKSIEGIMSLNKGSVVQFGEGNDISRFEIIKNTDETGSFPYEVNNGLSLGVRIKELPVNNGYLSSGAESDLTYDALYGFFSKYASSTRVMSGTEFRAQLGATPESIQEGKIYDARGLESEEVTKENIIPKLDELDGEGSKYGFGVGTYFTAPEEEKDGTAETRTWKVNALGDDWVEIANEWGNTERISLKEVIALALARRLKRVSKIDSESALLIELREHGITYDAQIKDALIIQKGKDEKGNTKDEPLRVFADGDGGHIRVDAIGDGKVRFGEYDYEGETHEVSGFAEKKGTKAAFKKFYKTQILTYGAFLEYLKKGKLKASTNDIIDTHAHTEHAHDHSHMEGSLLSRIGKMQNPSSLWKGLEMVWHSLEHTLEKGAKLDAARFAMKVGKYIPGDSVEAQLFADIVDGSKEIVEKMKNKIINLPGPRGRKKCIHIAHNLDARPEEVMAAIQFMVSGYGQLYAEDIKHYQSTVSRANLASKPMGYFAFLDAFIHTARLPGGIDEWRQKAYNKAKPELGSEGEPPEEMLLHALFKSIDGNPDKYPYAASVVKAIGGPGGFEKDWKFEGTKNATQKGKDQTTMVNPQGRLNKAVGYLNTHEIYKGIGAMEKVAGKVKDPKYQAFPFVWAVGGFSKHASPSALQDIKNYAQNGLSYHGYAFMRKEEDNMLYRDTVRLALAELRDRGKISQSEIDGFNAICDRMDHGPENQEITEKKYGKVSPPAAMMKFWQEHQHKGLNDMLQGHDGWLTVTSKKNSTVAKYRSHLIGEHSTMLKDGSIPGTEFGKDWYDEHGIGMNLIMRDSEVKPGVRSLSSNLNKIKFGGTNRGGRPMDDNNRMKIWDYVVNNIDANRSLDRYYGDESLQKEEFLAWREEIITFFNKEISAGEVKDDAEIERLINTRGYSYFKDLEKLGIDPRAIFKSELFESNAESDYQAWKSRSHTRSSTSSSGIIDRVKGKATGVGSVRPAPWRDPDDVGGRQGSREIPFEDSD